MDGQSSNEVVIIATNQYLLWVIDAMLLICPLFWPVQVRDIVIFIIYHHSASLSLLDMPLGRS